MMDILLAAAKVFAVWIGLALAIFLYSWLCAGSRIERAARFEARLKQEWQKYSEARAELEAQRKLSENVEESVAAYRKQRGELVREIEEKSEQCEGLKNRVDELSRLKETMRRDINALRTWGKIR